MDQGQRVDLEGVAQLSVGPVELLGMTVLLADWAAAS